MTWEDWIGSNFNTLGVYESTDTTHRIVSGGNYVGFLTLDTGFITIKENIKENINYYFQHGLGGSN